jgi:hypothetical protein
MSISDFSRAKEIAGANPHPSVTVLAMAMLFSGSTETVEQVKKTWPGIYDEFYIRKSSPSGILAEEAVSLPKSHPVRKHYVLLRKIPE